MNKILGSWSAMRNYLEKDMLCDSLKGRIRYYCTKYPNMDGFGVFEIVADGKIMKRFSMETVAKELKNKNPDMPENAFWKRFWEEKRSADLNDRREFDDEEFCEGLKLYRALSIGDSLKSENPVTRMFAIMDRRVGKRKLEELKNTVLSEPEWLQEFYWLRMEAEKKGLS